MSLYDGNHHLEPTAKRALLTDRHGRRLSAQRSHDIPVRRFRDSVHFPALLDVMETLDRFDQIVAELKKPNGEKNLLSLCRKHDVTLHELQVLYIDHMRQLGLIQAANALPRMMEDVASDSLNKLVICGRCEGKGKVSEEKEDARGRKRTTQRTCIVCEGLGRVVELGDKHARDMMAEAYKIVGGKGAVINQAIQNNYGGGVLDAGLEKTLKLTQTIALNAAQVRVVEEEPVLTVEVEEGVRTST